jgi:autotransporter-associated beta strand protein
MFSRNTRSLPGLGLAGAGLTVALLIMTAGSAAWGALIWDANGTGAGQTNGAGAWLGTNLWWNGTSNQDWVTGSDAVFGVAATAGGAVTLASPTTVESLTFNQFTGTYTLGTAGQTITLNAGITKNAGSAAVSIISPVTLGAAQSWTNNSTGTLTTANGANLITNGGYQLTVDGTGNTTFGVINNDAASITGSGDLVKNGSGTLALCGVNAAFTGNVTVNAGVLRVTKPTSINGNLNLAGGVYEHYWSDAYTRTFGTGAGQIQITGGVSGFSENGATGVTFTLNNNAAFELVWGSALFNPSTFVLQAATAQAGSSLTLPNKIDLNGASRTVEVNQTAGTVTATMSGVIRTSSGTAGLTKTGSGLLILSGTNTYNGGTTISNGTLRFPKIVSMPASGDVAVNTGTLSINLGGTGEWTAGTSGNGTLGGLLAGLGGQIGSTVTYSGNVGLDLVTTGTQTYTGNIANVGTSLAITKSGTGTLVLPAANT